MNTLIIIAIFVLILGGAFILRLLGLAINVVLSIGGAGLVLFIVVLLLLVG